MWRTIALVSLLVMVMSLVEARKRKNENRPSTNVTTSSGLLRGREKNDERRKEISDTECTYLKGNWSVCDTANNTMSRLLMLKNAGGLRSFTSNCPQNKTVTKKCKRKKSMTGCNYNKGRWSTCDPKNNSMTRVLTLKMNRKGAEPNCEHTKIVTKRCPKECKYAPGEWSECSAVTNTMTRNMTLKKVTKVGRGSQANGNCEPTKTVTKKCKKAKPAVAECSYAKGPWRTCEVANNTMSRTLTLKTSGRKAGRGAENCELTKIEIKPCKGCKYDKGAWGACNAKTGIQLRTDSLKKASPSCQPTVTKTRQCKRTPSL